MTEKTPHTGLDKLYSYCEGVKSGEIEVCKWVRLAVERHYKDLERFGINHYDPDKGKFDKKKGSEYYFDPGACQYYVDFFEENLQHYDGVFAGKPFIFEPWQWFSFASPFGWLKYERIEDKAVRRFSELDVFVPKKQGKSIWIGGTMLFMLEYDNYPGAQVYALALNQSHAKTLGYRDAEILAKKAFKKFNVKGGAATSGIYFEDMNAHIKPMVSDAIRADGPKIHMAANDEVKDWENFALYNTLVNGTASDPMALIVNISTAGDNKISLGYERQSYLEQVLDGRIEDETTFGVIYTIDTDKEDGEEKSKDEKEWDTERVLRKANPNYGITVGSDYYQKRIKSAQNSQANKSDFLTKHLNVWVDSLSGWLNMDAWDACGDKELSMDDVAHYSCVVSVDLASKIDLTVVEINFFGDDQCYTFPFFYLPDAVLQDDKKYNEAMRSQLRRWADNGHIELTQGVTVDYDVIKDKVLWAFREFDVIDMPYDPWNATQFANDLQKEGIDVDLMTEYSQMGYSAWTEPMKTTEQLILEGRLKHTGSPVMRWNMGNVVVRIDNNDNIRPLKELPQNKIDGAVALFMGVARGYIAMEEDNTGGEVFAL